jgi:hypothetical protein
MKSKCPGRQDDSEYHQHDGSAWRSWLTSLVAGYFVLHKPWPAGTPSAPSLCLDLVVVLAMA